MRQFEAVLVDAWRLLKARALFWITLGISVFAAVIYLSIGFDEDGVTFFFGAASWENDLIRKGSPLAEMFYLGIFSVVIVNLWLAWVAVALALITCAPLFPEFMAEGSAGAVLCKPIGRVRLFLYKYLSGLLFALIQTAAFCVVVFVAIGWRIGTWNPSVFWAVPLVVLMFSYLWAAMVLVGIRTRSVMASVLAALGLWLASWAANLTEEFAYAAAEMGEFAGTRLDEDEQAEWRGRYVWMSAPYKVLPKTGDTVELLQRLVSVRSGGQEFSLTQLTNVMATGAAVRDEELEAALRRHPAGFVVGSSLAFEALLVAMAAWLFSKRDF